MVVHHAVCGGVWCMPGQSYDALHILCESLGAKFAIGIYHRKFL